MWYYLAHTAVDGLEPFVSKDLAEHHRGDIFLVAVHGPFYILQPVSFGLPNSKEKKARLFTYEALKQSCQSVSVPT